QGILVVGSNLRMEVPIVAHRVRKAARKGASVAFVNPAEYEYHFNTAAYVTAGDALVENLGAVLAAAATAAGTQLPQHRARATSLRPCFRIRAKPTSCSASSRARISRTAKRR